MITRSMLLALLRLNHEVGKTLGLANPDLSKLPRHAEEEMIIGRPYDERSVPSSKLQDRFSHCFLERKLSCSTMTSNAFEVDNEHIITAHDLKAGQTSPASLDP